MTSTPSARDFPILAREVNGRAAGLSRQRRLGAEAAGGDRRGDPRLSHEYANVHRGLHYLSTVATEALRGDPRHVAAVPECRLEDEIVFTTGTTEGINMVAYAWAMPRFEPGDEIVLSVMEHHANIVPWHFLRERQGVVLKWVDCIRPDGSLDPQAVLEAIGPKTRLVAVTHMSNVLGTGWT